MPAFKTAYELAREKFRDLDRRLARVALKRPQPVLPTVSKRAAADVPFTPRPISILRPEPETPISLRQFVREEFVEASRKRERRST